MRSITFYMRRRSRCRITVNGHFLPLPMVFEAEILQFKFGCSNLTTQILLLNFNHSVVCIYFFYFDAQSRCNMQHVLSVRAKTRCEFVRPFFSEGQCQKYIFETTLSSIRGTIQHRNTNSFLTLNVHFFFLGNTTNTSGCNLMRNIPLYRS